MAQDSGFWDDNEGGDAQSTDVWSSPYNASERADWFSKLLGSDVAGGYVISGYNNELEVTAETGMMQVNVASGALFFRGRMYENTASEAVSLSAADGSNPRIDRIVAEITFATPNIRAVVVTGTAAATPAEPALTQNTTTYQIELAQVWVPASATDVDDQVWNKRIFAPNFNALWTGLNAQNLIPNSEHMLFDSNATDEDGWSYVATSTGVITKPTLQTRGQAVSLSGGSPTATITFNIKASTAYALRGLLYVFTPTVTLTITTDAGAPDTQTLEISREDEWLDLFFQYTTEADATTMTITIAGTGAEVFYIGQWLAMEGWLAGPYRSFHETVLLKIGSITDSNFNVTAYSSGTVTIDFAAAGTFGDQVIEGTRGVVILVGIRDSGSAAGSPQIGIAAHGGAAMGVIALGGVPNDTLRYQTFFVPFLNDERQIDLIVTASGASTLDIVANVVGVLT